jgi:hypothetical protein
MPPEIVFKIIALCDITSLRNLRKVSEFSQYYLEIGKLIQKSENDTANYYTSLINNHIRKLMLSQISYQENGIRVDGDRWPDNLIGATQKSIITIRDLLSTVKNIDTLLVKYSKKLKEIEEEVPQYWRVTTRHRQIILRRQLKYLLEILIPN